MDDAAAWLLSFVSIGVIVSVAVIVAGALRRKVRAWRIHYKLKSAAPRGPAIPEAPAGDAEPPALTTRLYELEKVFAPIGSDAAHPSALYVQAQFIEAVRLLALPGVPLAVVLQYVEGNSWALSSAALAALRKRLDRDQAGQRVLACCENFPPWTMYFALQLLSEIEPRAAVGAPLARPKEWWVDNRWMPNIVRDYFAARAAGGDAATFGPALNPNAEAQDILKRFLGGVAHPSAAILIREIEDAQETARDSCASSSASAPSSDGPLRAIGRFWDDQYFGALVEPVDWQDAFRLAESTLRQQPGRCLLVSGEPLVGKTSFLRLLAKRLASDHWRIFEASGADLQADQVYIGQLEAVSAR